MSHVPFVESALVKQDLPFEIPLRPRSLDEFVGQNELCKKLHVLVEAAKERQESLAHILLSGPPGLGKTTLAHILSQAMAVKLVVTSGPVLEKAGDLAGILTSLKPHDILFIDEIHRLNRNVEEYLYPAMEDFNLDIVIDSGPGARSVQVKLNPFTLVGATTKSGLLSAPMRSRFVFNGRLDFYSNEMLQKIVLRSCSLMKINLSHDCALEIAKRSRGTPRICNNLVKWVRDFGLVNYKNQFNLNVVQEALELLSINSSGLDEMDLKLLSIIIDHYSGGPVGLSTIALALGEDPRTVEEVLEPYLVMQGFLKRTPRGRQATALAYQLLQKNPQGEKDV
jgi:Holliday junction DNA helicase RuvB